MIVDLTELVFADASLMLDLAMLARRLRAHGRAMLLRGAQPQIRTLIELVGLHRLPGRQARGSAPPPRSPDARRAPLAVALGTARP